MPRRYPDYLPQARAVWRDQHDIEVQAETPSTPGSVTKPRIVGNEIEADARRAREGRSGRRPALGDCCCHRTR